MRIYESKNNILFFILLCSYSLCNAGILLTSAVVVGSLLALSKITKSDAAFYWIHEINRSWLRQYDFKSNNPEFTSLTNLPVDWKIYPLRGNHHTTECACKYKPQDEYYYYNKNSKQLCIFYKNNFGTFFKLKFEYRQNAKDIYALFGDNSITLKNGNYFVQLTPEQAAQIDTK